MGVRGSRRWPIAATSTARRSWPARRLGVTPIVPKPLTSGAKADGRFGKQDFVYVAGEDVYRCPAGEKLTWRYVEGRGRAKAASLLDDANAPAAR